MSDTIIGASVAIKWVVEEPASDRALTLRQHDLAAPDLLMSDCANTVWKKARLGEFTRPEASLAIRLLARAELGPAGNWANALWT